MAAPEYVPKPKYEQVHSYESPPWRPEHWFPRRPGELDGPQPRGPRLGHPGPDQGYALKLARRFEGRLVLTPGEDEQDAIAGCVAVANKRASLFGRAPVIHDLTVAFTIWGFLEEADPDLVQLRKRYFQGVAHPHHYTERLRIADLVPVSTLKLPPDQLRRLAVSDPKREKLLGRSEPTAVAG
jgi:hypothetical protein